MFFHNYIHYENHIDKHIIKHINNIIINNRDITMSIHKEKILEFLKEKRVITSSELAKFLKVSWNTAQSYLMELALEGKIDRIKKEGVNLWLPK